MYICESTEREISFEQITVKPLLQYVEVWTFQYVAFECVTVCCILLQSVADCCSTTMCSFLYFQLCHSMSCCFFIYIFAILQLVPWHLHESRPRRRVWHCNTLQDVATHCNTLDGFLHYRPCSRTAVQHIATPCNMLRHTRKTATHSNPLHHTATPYNTLQHNVIDHDSRHRRRHSPSRCRSATNMYVL